MDGDAFCALIASLNDSFNFHDYARKSPGLNFLFIDQSEYIVLRIFLYIQYSILDDLLPSNLLLLLEEKMFAAFSFAESSLSIPSILTPEQVIDFGDDKSIMTYLSLLYNAFLGTFFDFYFNVSPQRIEFHFVTYQLSRLILFGYRCSWPKYPRRNEGWWME